MPLVEKSAGRRSRQEYIAQHKVSRVELVRPQDEALNPEADIADVLVHMADGSLYRGTVTTLLFIQEEMARARQEGGGIEGDYWFGDAIIMEQIEETKLAEIVADLIDSRQFEKAFARAEVGAAS